MWATSIPTDWWNAKFYREPLCRRMCTVLRGDITRPSARRAVTARLAACITVRLPSLTPTPSHMAPAGVNGYPANAVNSRTHALSPTRWISFSGGTCWAESSPAELCYLSSFRWRFYVLVITVASDKVSFSSSPFTPVCWSAYRLCRVQGAASVTCVFAVDGLRFRDVSSTVCLQLVIAVNEWIMAHCLPREMPFICLNSIWQCLYMIPGILHFKRSASKYWILRGSP